MSAIPADPSLTLGNFVSIERIRHLQDIAEALRPEDEANDDLQSLIVSNYRFQIIKSSISSMEIPGDGMGKLNAEIDKLKDEMADAAILYAKATVAAANKVEELEQKFGQTTISAKPESPIDFSSVDIKKFPLSSDSMKFDIQYFKNDVNDQSNEAHSSNISNFIAKSDSAPGMGTNTSGKKHSSINKMVTTQTSNHKIDGTLVITANCTHRMADIIAPVVLDPVKLLSAWNATYPNDYLSSAPMSMYNIMKGYEKQKNEEDKLYLLTGCTRASSFTGFAHVTQLESTDNTESTDAEAAQMSKVLEEDQLLQASLGNFGTSDNFAKQVSSLLSQSTVRTHCNLITRGVIPDIASNTMKTTVMSMKPDARGIMEKINGMSEASKGPIDKTSEEEAEGAKNEQQLNAMDRSYMDDIATELIKNDDEANQVIDTNSMLTAFTNYVAKCEGGGVGVPNNFYVMEINKQAVAREYFKKFYPSGRAQTMEDRRAGILGQVQEGAEASDS